MMRFTGEIRKMIVAGVLGDIPKVNYAEKMRKRAEQIGIDAMPPKVRAVWKDSDMRHYITHGTVHLDCMSLVVPGFPQHGTREQGALVRADPELVELHRLHDEQASKRGEIRLQLEANLNACNTRAQFIERMPELEKYAPAEEATPRNLPTTTAMIDNLKAAGLKLDTKKGRK